MRNFLITSFLCSNFFLSPQSTITKDSIANVFLKATYGVDIETDLIYGFGLGHDSFEMTNPRKIPLKLDVYTPKNDFKNRPILVLIHGGGFKNGSKSKPPFIKLSNFFSSRGWVVFNINYRLTKDYGKIPGEWNDFVDANSPPDKRNQHKAVYPAIRDAKAAVRWIVANKNKFGVNPNYITIGGGSAGAVSAIAVGISENDDYKSELSIKEDNTLLTTNLNISFKVKTILDFWGSKSAIDAISILYKKELFNKNNPAIFIAHGTDDDVVPYNRALELEGVYKKTGAPYIMYSLDKKGHGPWEYTEKGLGLGDLALRFIVKKQALEVY